jgi:hypothetical protein
MTHRILPRADYARLDGTYLAPLRRAIPEQARVVIVEDEQGQIIASWLAFAQVHLEGVNIADDYRHSAQVVRHLLRGMREAVDELGASRVTSASDTEMVTDLLLHMGAEPLPGQHFVMEASCLSV